jgi:hypothetical protein
MSSEVDHRLLFSLVPSLYSKEHSGIVSGSSKFTPLCIGSLPWHKPTICASGSAVGNSTLRPPTWPPATFKLTSLSSHPRLQRTSTICVQGILFRVRFRQRPLGRGIRIQLLTDSEPESIIVIRIRTKRDHRRANRMRFGMQ